MLRNENFTEPYDLCPTVYRWNEFLFLCFNYWVGNTDKIDSRDFIIDMSRGEIVEWSELEKLPGWPPQDVEYLAYYVL